MHTTEYYSASKKKEVLTYVVAWKGIGDLSKMNQSQKTHTSGLCQKLEVECWLLEARGREHSGYLSIGHGVSEYKTKRFQRSVTG